MSDDFIEMYINDCVSIGISSPKKICEKALEELDIVDKELSQANELRTKRKNLLSILKSFDHDSIKKFKKTNDISNMSDMDNDNPLYKESLIKICLFIENNNRCISKREIMDHVGGLEQNQLVYMAIKWLCDRGILVTNEDRTLSKGENWESRPVEETQIAV